MISNRYVFWNSWIERRLTGLPDWNTELDIKLLSYVTAYYVSCGNAVSTTDLDYFSNLLPTKKDLLVYESTVNEFLEFVKPEAAPVFVGRHFVGKAPLLSRKDAYLASLSELFALADSVDVELCLGYGTLLGCVRESPLSRTTMTSTSFSERRGHLPAIRRIRSSNNFRTRFERGDTTLLKCQIISTITYPRTSLT